MSRCLICHSAIEPFVSFGRMPIANNFLFPDEFRDEFFYELKVGYCEGCHMVQLVERVEPERLFHDHYAFYSSTSSRMARHFEEFADDVCQNYLKGKDPFVVEIGSNDGIMLRHFAHRGLKHLGIEPSKNVAQVALDQHLDVISEFFSVDLAAEIVRKRGKADAILGANVMCHIPNLHSVAEGIKQLLKPEGVLIFEDPYLGDIVEKTSYDQIYDEHVFYFSLHSISGFFEGHGMEVIDIVPQDVHGGSMRYVIARKNGGRISDRVKTQLAKERAIGLDRPETFDSLSRNIERSRDELIAVLRDLKTKGKRVVGYGATSKSTTVINYCGITPDLVQHISDTTPIKQGKYSPGGHIPIRPYESFCADYPDVALLFAWNHADEIMAKEKRFLESGGKWLTYIPKVEVIG